MGLRDIGATLPPGFRFYPSDEEIVCHYLYKKIANEEVLKGTLVEIDLHTCEPWQLPEVAKLNSSEWYFFSFRDRKYATGYRTNRATNSGYWKATGKDRSILDPRTRAVVGMRKTLVFYKNRAPNGIKTGWIMHEFRLENPHVPPKEDWVLCRVFHKAKQEEKSDGFETAGVASYSPNLASSLPPPANHNNQQLTTSSLSLPVNPNFLQLSNHHHRHHQIMNRDNNNSSLYQLTKCNDDEYGFLFDMSFDESSLGDGIIMGSNLEDIKFDSGNGLVFL